MMWCDENGGKVQGPSRYVIMVPADNANSMGYNPKATGRPIESWSELSDESERWRWHCSTFPCIAGAIDCALAIEALGLKKFGDKGNIVSENRLLIDY